MIARNIKARLALRLSVLGILIFYLSFGIYGLAGRLGPAVALVLASLFFAMGLLASAYLLAAQELWVFRRLSEGGDKALGWSDLPDGERVPDEALQVREVMVSLKRDMDEAVLSQKRFLADASHEMRSPITIMRGGMEIALRRERDADEYKRVLASCLEEINRLEFLLKDLMFLARTDANELVMNMAELDLGEVLSGVCEGMAPVVRKKEVGLYFSAREGDGYTVEGDRDRLKQLFVNLVENAVRYTPAGGRVDVGLKRVAGVCFVTVADTGIGIPEGEIGKIFERFYRVDKARARESGGTGLGLCICKWIVEAHNGEIIIESREGEGTTVTVMFL